MEYTFTLKYQLVGQTEEARDALVERLAEAGCDDALIGLGIPGRIALEFTVSYTHLTLPPICSV